LPYTLSKNDILTTEGQNYAPGARRVLLTEVSTIAA